jgi:dienelactone hydrolase
MSHGDAGSRYNMETVCEYLAANGYVVIAPEHTGNSPFSMIGRDPALALDGGDPDFRARMSGVLGLLGEHGEYGDVSHFGQSYSPLGGSGITPQGLAALDQSLVERVNDLRATLDKLAQLNQRGFFAGALNLESIGLMGRSFGGATTLAGLALEGRFTAGLAVVPPSLPDIRAALPAELLAPPESESALLASEGPYALGEINKPTLLLSGAEDALIIGLAASMAASAGAPAPSPENPHPFLRAAFEQSTAPVVWGLLADSNHASFGVAGPWWWPRLKPDQFPRYFDPAEQYTLVDAQLAHRIQRELALAFFDWSIRGDEGALAHLAENPWEKQGFALESRNLP